MVYEKVWNSAYEGQNNSVMEIFFLAIYDMTCFILESTTVY